jgi:hypothetical protein
MEVGIADRIKKISTPRFAIVRSNLQFNSGGGRSLGHTGASGAYVKDDFYSSPRHVSMDGGGQIQTTPLQANCGQIQFFSLSSQKVRAEKRTARILCISRHLTSSREHGLFLCSTFIFLILLVKRLDDGRLYLDWHIFPRHLFETRAEPIADLFLQSFFSIEHTFSVVAGFCSCPDFCSMKLTPLSSASPPPPD